MRLVVFFVLFCFVLFCFCFVSGGIAVWLLLCC